MKNVTLILLALTGAANAAQAQVSAAQQCVCWSMARFIRWPSYAVAGGNTEFDVPSGSPLMQHLQFGSFFQLQMAAGTPVSNLSLRGSKRALAQVITYC